MQEFLNKLKGDRSIWAIAALLALFSFLPVYSAASNLAYMHGSGSTFTFFLKHFMHLSVGFVFMYFTHLMPYRYLRGLSFVGILVALVLLGFTMLQGTTIEGANASRWIQIPIVGMSFQTSTFASLVLMIYVARYMAKMADTPITFKESILPLWMPVFLVLILILPANFSTAALIFLTVIILVFLGGYPIKYLAIIIGMGVLCLAMFVLVAKAFPDAMPNRVDTWMSRVENFSNGEDTEEDYQIEKAKIAIASGGIKGVGPGKSVQKNFLPQSSSDFIYAIVVEEYGLIGAVILMSVYLLLLFRIVVVSHKAKTIFGSLVVLGVGLPIVIQALLNMAVAVELFPVTGQTLPLISSGGTSIWMTCLAVGIILSVSANSQVSEKEEEIDEENPLEILSEAI
ncbi:cell division protein FtsW [Formosa agariphila KMM 3901]|uniref:Probable peptidoglycan glycosyltransferase FtsW n=1 Tax=Formosa agariphila (strain DSM 15362 / KCTC 12365 / LMG 23005 / KMM 3901 / M-2Alg 35-1) TaxID=1347342 RepID=T2KQ84_FORAG|nr:FtsW/RodA/SpoVE family cell cycle protein [Formosa agariphila]CDF80663.1 cell division protein FtsW [Formosa agariphila KMM 3901]